MLQIYVISLADAEDRRAQAREQFAKQTVNFQFFDALDGEEGRKLFESCDDDAFVLHTGRVTTAGEIGCFASHKALWQRCADDDEAIMIMEDDFNLTGDFANAVAVTDALIAALGLIRLQDERRGASKPILQFGEFQLERYTKTPHCAMCYAITPELARRLLDLHKVYYAPVDVVMKHVWTFDNPMYCLTPYTVTGSELSFDSMIGDRDKCSKAWGIRIRRSMLKIGWQWKRLMFNLVQSDAKIRARCAELQASYRSAI